MCWSIYCDYNSLSPPSRRRGLKIANPEKDDQEALVASFAEAWIENSMMNLQNMR